MSARPNDVAAALKLCFIVAGWVGFAWLFLPWVLYGIAFIVHGNIYELLRGWNAWNWKGTP